MRRALAGALLLAACDSPTEPPGEPRLEYLVVDADYGDHGRTAVGWSHPKGADALDMTTAGAWFWSRSASGTAITGGFRLSTRQLPDGTVEVMYSGGTGADMVRASIADVGGRRVTYECEAPAWRCFPVE